MLGVRMATAVASLALVADSAIAKVMIFAGRKHDEYLGYLVCSDFSSDSICNDFRTYGNTFSAKGIFNEFSEYGNQFFSRSPWNEFSQSKEVPILVDDRGNFYGYFTINYFRSDAVDFSESLKSVYFQHDGNLEESARLYLQDVRLYWLSAW